MKQTDQFQSIQSQILPDEVHGTSISTIKNQKKSSQIIAFNLLKCGIFLIASLWLTTSSWAQELNTIVVVEEVTTDSVIYTLRNDGDTSITVSYIIIQDHVMMMVQDTVEIGEQDSVIIDLHVVNATDYEFSLEWTELSGASSRSIVSLGEVNTKECQLGSTLLYPNPVSDQFFLSLPKTRGFYELQIFDWSGRSIFRQKGLESCSNVNISHLNSGLYILRVLSPECVWTGELVVR